MVSIFGFAPSLTAAACSPLRQAASAAERMAGAQADFQTKLHDMQRVHKEQLAAAERSAGPSGHHGDTQVRPQHLPVQFDCMAHLHGPPT